MVKYQKKFKKAFGFTEEGSGEELGTIDGNDFEARKKSKSLILQQKINAIQESDDEHKTFN